jgi:hypothetical protein
MAFLETVAVVVIECFYMNWMNYDYNCAEAGIRLFHGIKYGFQDDHLDHAILKAYIGEYALRQNNGTHISDIFLIGQLA